MGTCVDVEDFVVDGISDKEDNGDLVVLAKERGYAFDLGFVFLSGLGLK